MVWYENYNLDNYCLKWDPTQIRVFKICFGFVLLKYTETQRKMSTINFFFSLCMELYPVWKTKIIEIQKNMGSEKKGKTIKSILIPVGLLQ